MRGFGKSSVPAGPYAHRDDLAALLRHLNLDSAHVVGLSMGGNIGIEFALEYPKMVRSLALLDSALTGLPQRAPNLDANSLGLAEAKRQWLESDLFASSRKRPQALSALKETLDDYSGWHWLHKNTEIHLDPTPAERLSEIQISTVVMLGVEDVAWFHSSSDVLCSEIRGAEFVTIPEAGHMSNLDNPTTVNRELIEWLSRQESAL